MKFTVPAESGVYVFRDKDGSPIYVGSSVNMKIRVSTNRYRRFASSVETFPCRREELVSLEQKMMDDLCPTLNKARRAIRKADRFIARSGGVNIAVFLTSEEAASLQNLAASYDKKKQLVLQTKKSSYVRILIKEAAEREGTNGNRDVPSTGSGV